MLSSSQQLTMHARSSLGPGFARACVAREAALGFGLRPSTMHLRAVGNRG
jgi:hypothetical protein